MSEFTWVGKSEFEELKAMVYGIRSNRLDIKYHSGGINIDDNTSAGDLIASTQNSYPAKVTGKSGLYHTCDIYGSGIDQPVTIEGAKVFVLQLNLAETLPRGTWIMAYSSTIGRTGGGNVP